MPGFCRTEASLAASAAVLDARPRLLVTTDIGEDPDDQQTLVRLLAYANEFRIVGLVATASTTNVVNKLMLDGIVADYGGVQSNLNAHAPNYPAASTLSPLVKIGWGTRGLAQTQLGPSEGANHIISVVDASSAGEVTWITIWGGQVDLAQALFARESGTDFAGFLSKIRVYAIADQDTGVAAYLRGRYPALWYAESAQGGGTDQQFRGMYQNDSSAGIELVPTALMPLVAAAWITTNVHGHGGAFGTGYPDDASQNPTGGNNSLGVKEGDTPSWFYLLPKGLQDPLQPSWGGWGGRFAPRGGGGVGDFIEASDAIAWSTEANGNAAARRKWPVARWREHYQNDFQARMDWCNTATFTGANHNPTPALNGDTTKAVLQLNPAGDALVSLSAAGTADPDAGQTAGLSYLWWQYLEAGTYPAAVPLTGAATQTCTFTPTPQATATTLHMILEVTDNGTPPLKGYRRAVVNVPAAPLAAGGLLPVGTQPINEGLVYFVGSAPSGSSLLGREQFGGNPGTLLAGGNLTGTNASKTAWRCLDSTSTTNGGMHHPSTTQLRAINSAMSMWVHLDLDTASTFSYLLTAAINGDFATPNFSAGIRLVGNNAFDFGRTIGSTRVGYTSANSTRPATGQMQLGATWNSVTQEVKLYVGGTQVGSTPPTETVANGAVAWNDFPVVLLNRHHSSLGTSMDGAVYSAAIWNRVLSAGEFAALAAAPQALQQAT